MRPDIAVRAYHPQAITVFEHFEVVLRNSRTRFDCLQDRLDRECEGRSIWGKYSNHVLLNG
jgi:hypothetical protein